MNNLPTRELALAFIDVMRSRGNKALLYKHGYNGIPTPTEKDELLICSRIAKANIQAAK